MNKKKDRKRTIDETIVVDSDNLQKLKVPEFTSLDELSKLMKVSSQDVILKCIEMGMMVTINQRLDMESIQYIASEFGFDVDTLDIYTFIVKDLISLVKEEIMDGRNEKNELKFKSFPATMIL